MVMAERAKQTAAASAGLQPEGTMTEATNAAINYAHRLEQKSEAEQRGQMYERARYTTVGDNETPIQIGLLASSNPRGCPLFAGEKGGTRAHLAAEGTYTEEQSTSAASIRQALISHCPRRAGCAAAM